MKLYCLPYKCTLYLLSVKRTTGSLRRLETINVTSGLLAAGRYNMLFLVHFFQCSFTDHPHRKEDLFPTHCGNIISIE